MSASFTPGPWLIHGAMLGHKGDIFSPTAKQVKDCHHIARCFAPKPERAPACDLQVRQMERESIAVIEANTRLIAVAPELYQALADALELLDDCEIAHPLKWDDILARARGGSLPRKSPANPLLTEA